MATVYFFYAGVLPAALYAHRLGTFSLQVGQLIYINRKKVLDMSVKTIAVNVNVGTHKLLPAFVTTNQQKNFMIALDTLRKAANAKNRRINILQVTFGGFRGNDAYIEYQVKPIAELLANPEKFNLAAWF